MLCGSSRRRAANCGLKQPAGAHPAAGVPEEILWKAERCFRQADELGHMKAGHWASSDDL